MNEREKRIDFLKRALILEIGEVMINLNLTKEEKIEILKYWIRTNKMTEAEIYQEWILKNGNLEEAKMLDRIYKIEVIPRPKYKR